MFLPVSDNICSIQKSLNYKYISLYLNGQKWYAMLSTIVPNIRDNCPQRSVHLSLMLRINYILLIYCFSAYYTMFYSKHTHKWLRTFTIIQFDECKINSSYTHLTPTICLISKTLQLNMQECKMFLKNYI